ncbi:MAG: hypothetical protein V2G33_07755 [bacterium JZ-2024 1]
MGALARLSQLKSFLSIPPADTSQDEALKNFLLFASSFASSWCRRDFKKKSRTEYYTLPPGKMEIVLKHYPVESISRILTDGEEIPSSDYAFTPEGIVSLRREPPSPLLEITYTAGYDTSGWLDENLPFTVPADLEQAVVFLSVQCFRSSESGGEARMGIAHKAWGSLNVSFAHPDDLAPEVREILERYRRWDSGL